jgi:large subunit ribosomal protein L27Ae
MEVPRRQANASGLYHHRINFHKFKKVGMRHYHLKRNQSFCTAIDLVKLRLLVIEQTRGKAAKNMTGANPNIDIVKSVCSKLLGKRKLPEQPVIMKYKVLSRIAEDRTKGFSCTCALVV